MESKKALAPSGSIEAAAAIREALRNSIGNFVANSAIIFERFSTAPEAWKSICKKKIAGYAQENLTRLEYMALVLAESNYKEKISDFTAALESTLESSKGAKSIREALQTMDAGFSSALAIIDKGNKDLIFRR